MCVPRYNQPMVTIQHAWLILWFYEPGGHSEQALADEDKVVSILSGSASPREVAAVLEAFYHHFTSTYGNMAEKTLDQPHERAPWASPWYPYFARFVTDDFLTCGDLPELQAHRVRNLTVEKGERVDEHGDVFRETLTWDQYFGASGWVPKKYTAVKNVVFWKGKRAREPSRIERGVV